MLGGRPKPVVPPTSVGDRPTIWLGFKSCTAATSGGAFGGAAFAGMRGAGTSPTRRYAILGLVSAAAVAFFAFLPVGLISA